MNIYSDVFGFMCVAAVEASYSTPDPAVNTAGSWLQLVERFGIMACILAYFLYRDHMKAREEKASRLHQQVYLERVEGYIKDTLVSALQENNVHIAKNSSLMKRVADATGHCPGFRAAKTDGESDLFPLDQTALLDGDSNVQKQSPSGDGTPV